MAKKRDKKEEVKKEREEIDITDRIKKKLTFKHWLNRTIMIAIILFVIVYMVKWYIGENFLWHMIVGVYVMFCVGFMHEGLHYYKAVSLGYTPKWWRTTLKMGFTIEHHSLKTWKEDKKKIAYIPYYVLMPLSIAIIVIGYYYNFMGLMIGGGGSIILHTLTVAKEGREV